MRTRRGLIIAIASAVAVVALPITARASGTPGPTATTAAQPNYVALGDSYTAGPLIPLYDQPLGCLRSTNDYPHLVAPRIHLALRDESCSGATTDDMFSSQGVTPGPNPPQLDALDAGTRVVTLGIGGNDIGFSSIAQDCVTLDPTTSPCQDTYVVNGVDEISNRIAAVAPKVANVVQAIHDRAPGAQVFVVDYLPILPEDAGLTCWPLLPIAYKDIPYVRAKEKELNAMLGSVAAANGATFVDAYTPSEGHDSCQAPGLRWVEPLVPASPAAPIHPNLLGEEAYASVVTAAIQGHPITDLGLLPVAGLPSGP